MTDPVPVRKRQAPALIIVAAILQIVFGTVGVCTSLTYFSGAQQWMAKWQDDLQSKLPRTKGQPEITQTKILALMNERIPWLENYQRSQSGTGLILSAMMIAGGIGMFYLRPWARWVTLVWAFLSMASSISSTVVAVAYVTPVTREVTDQFVAEMPPPEPNKPDIRPMMKGVMEFSMTLALIASIGMGVLMVSYAITILILVTRPSAAAAFRAQPPPA